VNQRLATAIAVEDQIVCTPVPCNAVSKRLGRSAKPQTALIERLTDDENKQSRIAAGAVASLDWRNCL